MDEMVKKINDLLKTFNETFEVTPEMDKENPDTAIGFSITKIKNDGSDFVEEFSTLFSTLIDSTNEYKLLYDVDNGFIIAKQITTTTTEYQNAFK